MLLALVYTALSFWLNGMVDMKYMVDPYDSMSPTDIYYSVITHLTTVLCVSILLNILLFIVLWQKWK